MVFLVSVHRKYDNKPFSIKHGSQSDIGETPNSVLTGSSKQLKILCPLARIAVNLCFLLEMVNSLVILVHRHAKPSSFPTSRLFAIKTGV